MQDYPDSRFAVQARARLELVRVRKEPTLAAYEAFREKYGRTDWWYGVLLRRHPIPVRLDPDPEAV